MSGKIHVLRKFGSAMVGDVLASRPKLSGLSIKAGSCGVVASREHTWLSRSSNLCFGSNSLTSRLIRSPQIGAVIAKRSLSAGGPNNIDADGPDDSITEDNRV